MKISNITKHFLIAQQAAVADTFVSRMTGLLNRASLNPTEALIITRCQSIHMIFMRFAIDAIFVDQADRVVGVVENIKPFQLSPIFFKASYVIEIPAGVIDKSKTEVGDQLRISY